MQDYIAERGMAEEWMSKEEWRLGIRRRQKRCVCVCVCVCARARARVWASVYASTRERN
jgi:hypothetical protein